jgi:hypothetical protein
VYLSAEIPNRFGETTLGIDDHMIGTGLLGHGDLLLRRDAPDDMAAPQLDDLGQQQTEPTRRRGSVLDRASSS